MVVRTDTERAHHSRRLVLELLGSSVDLSLTRNVERWNAEYGADPARFGPAAEPATDRDEAVTGHHHAPTGAVAENVDQPVKVDNELYVRDYAKCILCYQCVDACGEQWQNTFAIGVAGRGFDARISTEYDVAAPRLGVRVLRQLHPGVPDRCPDVLVRAPDARGRHVGRVDARP